MCRFILRYLIFFILYPGIQGAAQWERIPVSGWHAFHVFKRYILVIPFDSSQLSFILRSYDEGSTWDTLSVNMPLAYNFVATDSGLYAGTRDGMFFSSDEGATWNDRSAGIERNARDERTVWSMISVGGTLYVGADSVKIFTTTDGGEHWNRWRFPRSGARRNTIGGLVYNGKYIFALDTDSSGMHRIYQFMPDFSYFDEITGEVSGGGYDVPRIFSIDGSLYAYRWNQGICRSDDDGKNWRLILADSVGGGLLWPRKLGERYISTWTHSQPWNLLISTDGGSTWRNITANLPDSPGDLAMSDRYIFINNYKTDGNWRRPLSQILAVHDEAVQVPGRFEIIALAPNPFFSQTTLTFTLPGRRRIILSIHDLFGRQIRIVADEMLEGGKQAIAFNARELPAGVYFYRLSADGVSIAGKMMVVR